MRLACTLLVAFLTVSGTGIVSAQPGAAPRNGPADEFFIVSSIDQSKGQLLLKRPTEVTDVVHVEAGTRYVDEHGRPITIGELRAGDTVFVRTKPGSGGAIAVEIRKGPMTIPELKKRYFQRGKK